MIVVLSGINPIKQYIEISKPQFNTTQSVRIYNEQWAVITRHFYIGTDTSLPFTFSGFEHNQVAQAHIKVTFLMVIDRKEWRKAQNDLKSMKSA